MRKILKFTLLLAFCLVTQNQFWHNLVFTDPVLTVIKVALILSIFEVIIKPIIKIITLPITFLTFGLFKIVITSLGFYLALFLLADFKLLSINLPSQEILGLVVPALNFSGFWAVIVNATTNYFLFGLFKLLVKTPKPKT